MNGMKKILFLICLFSLSFYSCAIRNALAPKDNLDAERTFTAQRINNGNSAGYFNISSQLVKTTDKLAIYLQNGGNISLYGLNKMAQDFDYYYDDMTNIYGGHSDIDANGKIIIVLMDINVQKTGTTTLAYFNPNDMHGNNQGEILYMDLSNANHNIDKSIGTLIHEFQHLINYSYYTSGKRSPMSSWLNEALSESTSILFNKTTAESRITNEFNNISYYCFYTWNLPDSYGLVNYPSASVFMHWLYNKNGNKWDIFEKIAKSTQNTDYNKVLYAAKGISGLSVSSWEDLLLTWMSDVVSNNVPKNGGYTKASVKTTNGTATLYPGAMVVYDSKFNDPTNSNIVTRTNTKNGNKIIVLNKDTTLGTAVSTKTVSGSSSVDLAARSRKRVNIAEKKEENQIINILLDENGNIQKY